MPPDHQALLRDATETLGRIDRCIRDNREALRDLSQSSPALDRALACNSREIATLLRHLAAPLPG